MCRRASEGELRAGRGAELGQGSGRQGWPWRGSWEKGVWRLASGGRPRTHLRVALRPEKPECDRRVDVSRDRPNYFSFYTNDRYIHTGS